MLFLTRPAEGALAECVARLWYGENSPTHSRELFLPTGEFDLIVNAHDGILGTSTPGSFTTVGWRGPLVAGPHTRTYVVETSQQASLLGAKFHPGGAFALFGVPLDSLLNRQVLLEDLWGPAATQLQERAMEAGSAAEKLVVLETALARGLSESRRPNIAAARAVRELHDAKSWEMGSVSAVADLVGLSPKHLGNLFHREVGLSPKVYQRLVRFRRSLWLLENDPKSTLTEIAIDSGFYDQSHMIREFQEFAGLTPGYYRGAVGRYDNQVPLAS